MHINLNLNLFKDCIDINGFIIPIQQGQQLQLNNVSKRGNECGMEEVRNSSLDGGGRMIYINVKIHN